MRNYLQEAIALDYSQDIHRVRYLACAALFTLALFSIYVFEQLVTVRPFLVFVSAAGEPPPVCGFCVLFGR